MSTFMQKYPESIKDLLREHAMIAYERDMHRELTKLDQSFAEWRDGTISSRELGYRVHHCETGPLRELSEQYTEGPADMSVAYAIVVGILDETEVPAELLEALGRPLGFYRSLEAEQNLPKRD